LKMSNRVNCFTVRRHGDLSEGIVLGNDIEGREALMVGRFWFNRDRFGGALVDMTGAVPMICRAVLRERGGNGKRKFTTLCEPKSARPTRVLIKVSLGLPLDAVVKIGDREIHVATDVCGNGQIVKRDGHEALVSLGDGEEVSFLFPDGWVRTFRNREGDLRDIMLSAEGMLEKRIAFAFRELECARAFFDATLREKKIHSILSGMADLIHLTMYAGNGQELRIKLIRDFFYGITQAELGLVHRKLTAVLHHVDPVLVSMLSSAYYATSTGHEKASVVSIDSARNSAVEQARRKAARAQRDRDFRNSVKGHAGAKPATSTGKKKSK
jgi:hypothetical protein